MPRRGFMGLAAVGAVAALALAACGGGSSSSGGRRQRRLVRSRGFNAAITKVVNPSNTKTSGTIYFGNSSTPDSTDPGNTYYAMMWNFSRLYTMPLMTYASCPGACGLKVVPDLATAPGIVSRQRADLDLPHQAQRQVRGRHHGHLAGRQVRRRAHLRPDGAPARPVLLPAAAGAAEARPTRARSRTGPRTSWG